MMKLKLFFFGKKSEITDREQELVRRIGFRSQIDLIPLSQAGIKEGKKAKEKEGELLTSKLDSADFLVAFDEKGAEKDSKEFSRWLKDTLVEQGTVCFVIGGAHGLSQEVLNRANLTLRFGKMVWTRDLFRLMACEQIYRALEIDGGGNFHKS